MKKVIFFLPLFWALNACVSNADYQKLKMEKDELLVKIDSLSAVNDSLKIEITQTKFLLELSQVKEKEQYYRESQAKEYLKDYYEFYERGLIYRNVKTRRIANNKFVLSYEEADKSALKADFPSWWDVVRYLTINNDGTYNLSRNGN